MFPSGSSNTGDVRKLAIAKPLKIGPLKIPFHAIRWGVHKRERKPGLCENVGMEDFDFPAAMQKAREGLEKLLVEYAADHPESGYRDLGDKFNLSLGAISKIMKRWETLRRNIKRYKKHLRTIEGELRGLITKKTAQKTGCGHEEDNMAPVGKGFEEAE